MSPDAIEAILHEFRAWLSEAPPSSTASAGPGESIDLFTLMGQFTALRHEVNMQTKAARAAVESNAETLNQLAAVSNERQATASAASNDEEFRPLLKAVLDIADALDLASTQVGKLRGTIEPFLTELRSGPEIILEFEAAAPGGLLARMLRSFGDNSEAVRLREQQQAQARMESERAGRIAQAAAKVSQLLNAASEGYTLSRRRIERVLPTFDLERITAQGEMFDPDTMEAVERIEGSDRPPGEVLQEVRPGYLWRGRVMRYAQVRVASV